MAVVPLGGGGMVIGMQMAGGTAICNVDVANCYIRATDTWKPGTGKWKPGFTAKSLPKGDYGPDKPHNWVNNLCDMETGCYAAALAPSKPSVLYATYNALLYRSSNKGAKWTRCNLPAQRLMSNSGRTKYSNDKLAVHPKNDLIAILGTCGTGVHYTLDGGANFAEVQGLAPARDNPYNAPQSGKLPNLVCFDPTGERVWISVDGTGIYQSQAGVTGKFDLMPGGPISPTHMTCDASGALWICDYESEALHKWDGTSWRAIKPFPPFRCPLSVAVQGQLVACVEDPGSIAFSYDGGETWRFYWAHLDHFHHANPVNPVEWLGGFAGQMFPSKVLFDLRASGWLFMAHGLGVSFTHLGTVPPAKLQWIEATAGIENMVANHARSIPGNPALFLAVEDQACWKVGDLAKYTNFRATPTGHRQGTIHHCWSVDGLGDYLVQLTAFNQEDSGFSVDGGRSWIPFEAKYPINDVRGKPCVPYGGSVAVAEWGKVLVVPANNWPAVVTRDNGKNWQVVDFPGLPRGVYNEVETGWGWAYFLKRQIACADKTAGTFYAFNYGPSAAPQIAGVHRSEDGSNWHHVYHGSPIPWPTYHAKIDCAPGQTGHLFMCAGPMQAESGFVRSKDGGETWALIPGITRCDGFGFGKAIKAGGYPTVFFQGTLDGRYGLYASTDDCATWQFLTDYLNNCIDTVSVVAGDLNRAGRVIVGWTGSSFGYGDFKLT